MGFELYLPEDVQSCIISTFLFPDDPNFNFKRELCPTLVNQCPHKGMLSLGGQDFTMNCQSVRMLFTQENSPRPIVSESAPLVDCLNTT